MERVVSPFSTRRDSIERVVSPFSTRRDYMEVRLPGVRSRGPSAVRAAALCVRPFARDRKHVLNLEANMKPRVIR
jgi:hypothetical protein